jgi:hypothetical protein
MRVDAMQNYYIGCAVCGKPLRLKAAKAEDGLPIHEECYLLRFNLEQVTKPSEKENAAQF